MATLSGPANIFSIVGLADVVYRASKDLHDTFRRMQGSQQACTTLSQSLKNISAIAAEITVLPSDTNHQSILSTIHDILTDCRQELEGLQAIGNSVKHASIDTWVTKLRKSSTWAFSEREISQALRRLEQQKLSLAVALAGLIARRDVSQSEKLESATKEILECQQIIDSNARKVEQQIIDTSSADQDMMQGILTAVTTSDQSNTVNFQGLRSLARTNVETLDTVSKSVQISLSSVENASTLRHEELQRHLTRASHKAERGYNLVRKSRADDRQHRRNLTRQLTQLNTAIESLASLTLTENEDHTYTLEGTNLESLTLPVMLMKPALEQAFRTLHAQGRITVSALEAHWIRDELEKLLSDCHEASSRATKMRARLRNIKNQHTLSESMISRHTADGSKHRDSRKRFLGIRRPRFTHRYCQSTSVGVLILEYEASNRPSNQLTPTGIKFSYIPNPDICNVGVSAVFAKDSTDCKIHRSLRPVTIISNDRGALDIICRDDTDGLKKMLSMKLMSPFDWTMRGESVLSLACRFGSLNALNRLMEECGNIANLVEDHLLRYFWEYQSQLYGSLRLIGPFWKTCNLLVEKGALLDEEKHKGEPLHRFLGGCFFQTAPRYEKNKMIEFLVQNELDINGRNEHGYTPLLTFVTLTSLNFSYHNMGADFQLLISNGANIDAVSSNGSSVLHLLFSRYEKGTTKFAWSTRAPYIHILPILNAALIAGSDPNALNNHGASVSDCAAKTHEGWTAWMTAINKMGYTMVDMNDSCYIVLSYEDQTELPISGRPLREFARTHGQLRSQREAWLKKDAWLEHLNLVKGHRS